MSAVKSFLHAEARSLATRLDRLLPFTVTMPMVPAANVPPPALAAIETLLKAGRERLRRSLARFQGWLASPLGIAASDEAAQQKFTIIRLAFHANIAQFDLFADVLAQRSEHETGVWIAGLDDFAADALRLPHLPDSGPPMVCYLDRGIGAAIRRARTRLPGGDLSPVAIIRVPRERMVGQGIGSSLVHEVGHQAAAVYDLLPVIRRVLTRRAEQSADELEHLAWTCWMQWCSEIVSDLWAVAYLGTSGTLGLMGVVSLPRPFVFRFDQDDPHPFPYVRVLTSAALGNALYPDPRWSQIASMWMAMYPTRRLSASLAGVTTALRQTLPEFTRVLLGVRPRTLGGRTLGESLIPLNRGPRRLAVLWHSIAKRRDDWHRLPPTLGLAAIGQARADGVLTPEAESEAIGRLLREWAVRSALDATAGCRQPLSTLWSVPASRLPNNNLLFS